MKVAAVSHADGGGGAARAAYRIHQALRAAGVDSQLHVAVAASGDRAVHGPEGRAARLAAWLRPRLGNQVRRLLRSSSPVLHSPAIVPSRWAARLNASDADLVHLHWVNAEMMSIADIGRLRKPVVWTLHDMWAFCGAEHLTEEFRWKAGYEEDNRPPYERGFDLNRWTWQRKRRHWRRPMQIVTPSRWLASCVEASRLMRGWPVRVVPNAIDVERWAPADGRQARSQLGLPQDVPLLLFGAMSDVDSRHKGLDLLVAALGHLRGRPQAPELVVFGQGASAAPAESAVRVHHAGQVRDDARLRLLYCAADAVVIASRQDNLPNNGLEAHACGRPVVAFDTGGLPDIVEHGRTGYLARPFDPGDLAAGIEWVIGEPDRNAALGRSARERAVAKWSYPVVASTYTDVYHDLLQGWQQV